MPLPFSTHCTSCQVPYALSLGQSSGWRCLWGHTQPQFRWADEARLCSRTVPLLAHTDTALGSISFSFASKSSRRACMSSTMHFHATETLFCLHFLTKEKKGNVIVVSVWNSSGNIQKSYISKLAQKQKRETICGLIWSLLLNASEPCEIWYST